jgi:hypothetical protein
MTALASFEASVDEALTQPEPRRSAALGVIAAQIRSAAWQGTHRGAALELAARAEESIDPTADRLAGLDSLAASGNLCAK